MTKFKVGDKVRVLDVDAIGGGSRSYFNGMVTEVIEMYYGHPKLRTTDDFPGVVITDDEYHAIELIPQSSSESERIDELERELRTLKVTQSAMKAELQSVRQTAEKALKESRKPVLIEKEVAKNAKAPTKPLTSNQRRAAVIERAKAFVEGASNENYFVGSTRKMTSISKSVFLTNKDGSYITDEVDYEVNADKRTVVALIRSIDSKKVIHRGIAKCAPDDVFNADIGKAIALARALGIDVPSEFIDAPKPSEPVVGMRVNGGCYDPSYYTADKVFTLTSVNERENAFNYDDVTDWIFREQIGDIIDDTNAEYSRKVSAQEVSA